MANNARQTSLTPAAAAARLGVEVYTVRRWCDWHDIHLSTGASPGPGALRKLTQRDIEVLSTVRDLRAQGLHTQTINEQLAGLTFAEIDTDEQSSADAVITSQNIPDAPESTELVIRLLDTMNVMQRQIDGIQHTRRDAVYLVAIGIIIGLLFTVGMIVLAWLYGG